MVSELPRVLVTRRMLGDGVQRLRAVADVDLWEPDTPMPHAELAARMREATGLLCMLTDRIDADLIDGSSRLKVISQMAVGVDNIDLQAAGRRGISVGHTPGVLVETTADLTFALMLAAARRVGEAERYLRAGKWTDWDPELLLGLDVHGATLGIVGMGAIGTAVARRGLGFGMKVQYSSRSDKALDWARRTELDALLSSSDVVSIHCALTPQTRALIGPRELRLMKPSAILVNTARGPIVDEEALVDALRSRRIAAAGLDVFATEPLPMDSRLLELDNAVLVPHIGSASVATRTRMADIAIANVIAGLDGEPLPHRVR